MSNKKASAKTVETIDEDGVVHEVDRFGPAEEADIENAAPTGASASRAVAVDTNLNTKQKLDAALTRLGLRVERNVTRPLLKIGSGQVIVTVQGTFYEGREVPNSTMGVPLMLDVYDHMSMLDCTLIAGAVLQSEMVRAYGTEDMAKVFESKKSSNADKAAAAASLPINGKVFLIAKIPVDGKRYAAYSITELAPAK